MRRLCVHPSGAFIPMDSSMYKSTSPVSPGSVFSVLVVVVIVIIAGGVVVADFVVVAVVLFLSL